MLARFWADQCGNMAIMFAFSFALAAVVSAFAVDAGALYGERRQLQSAVDQAALAAARDPANGAQLARDVLADAGLIGPSATIAELTGGAATSRLVVTPGNYRADPNIAPSLRFVAGQEPFNAVRVGFEQPGMLYFAKSWSPLPVLAASAIGTVAPQVSLSVGSRLASLNGGIANAVLDALLGSTVALTVADYNSLLGAKVDLLGLLDALATQLHVTVGTYDELLQLRADHGQLAAAVAKLLTGADRVAAQKLAGAIGHNGKVQLASLIDAGQFGRLKLGSSGENLLASVATLDLLAASAGLSDGTHQMALNLGANVPGLVGITALVAVGEPAQGGSFLAVGPEGKTVRTAQVRIKLAANLLGGPVLLGASVTLPLYLELASAEASVVSATCPTAAAPKGMAVIAVRPGVARITLGEVDSATIGNFSGVPVPAPASLVNALLLKIMGAAVVEIGQPTPIRLSFSSTDIANGTIKTARSGQLVSSLTGSLLGNLHLTITVLGLGLATPTAITAALNALLAPLAPTLDLTVDALLQALGLSLGEADVQVYGVTCLNPVLVG